MYGGVLQREETPGLMSHALHPAWLWKSPRTQINQQLGSSDLGFGQQLCELPHLSASRQAPRLEVWECVGLNGIATVPSEPVHNFCGLWGRSERVWF